MTRDRETDYLPCLENAGKVVSPTVETVRAALDAIGAKTSAPLEAAIRKLPAGPALQETRLRLIAFAQTANKTSEPAYHEALRLLDKAVRTTPRLATRADVLLRAATKKYAARRDRSHSRATQFSMQARDDWQHPRRMKPLE